MVNYSVVKIQQIKLNFNYMKKKRKKSQKTYKLQAININIKKKKDIMKNTIKTLIVMLSSISLFSTANAGELTVTGTAKATYNMTGGYHSTTTGGASRGLGVTNEFDLGAKGELDNGITWNYQIQMDPGNSGATTTADVQNDDSRLEITLPSYGTLGIYISEGGLDLEDGASQSVYGRPTDIGANDGVQDNYDVDGYNNMQLHTAADLLPYGLQFKVGYVPATGGVYGSGNNAGTAYTKATDGVGASATAAQIKANPIEGLNVGISTVQFNGLMSTGMTQEPASYAAMATYAKGAFTVGYSQAVREASMSANAHTQGIVQQHNQSNASVSFLVNDSLSLSYEVEKSEQEQNNRGLVHTEQKSEALQAAYTMGGMTLALSHGRYDNVSYKVGKEADQTLLAVTMAF